MKTKEIYNAPEMDSIILVKEAVLLNDSQQGSWDRSIKEGTTWGDSTTDYGME